MFCSIAESRIGFLLNNLDYLINQCVMEVFLMIDSVDESCPLFLIISAGSRHRFRVETKATKSDD